MSIKFLPREYLKKIAPERKIKKLMTKNVDLKKTALSFLDNVDGIDKKSVEKVALKTIKGYQQRIAKEQVDAGFQKSAGDELTAELVADPAQLIQRVGNEIIFQISQEIKKTYSGQRARWLPSGADEPRPLHQSVYGQEYIIGEGLPVGDDGSNVEPGDEFGCDCGIEILTDETELNFG